MPREEFQISIINGMRSERRSDVMTPESFWQWFAANADRIAADPNNADLVNQLDQLVVEVWPELAWEIGPDPSGDWYFALSPNLNRSLVASAEEAIRDAPTVTGWRLYPARQRKAWDGKFEFESQGRVLRFDSSGWQYVLLRYPEGDTEVVLSAPEAATLPDDDRWQAAAIVIEGLLGEACLLEHVNSFALEPGLDEKLSAKLKPLQQLPQAFGLH